MAVPDIEPKATEHIPDMIALINRLIEKGLAYPRGGDVYFVVRSLPGYGKLSGHNLDDLLAGARVRSPNKRTIPGFCALEESQAGRTVVGFTLGSRPARMAHRMLRHGCPISG